MPGFERITVIIRTERLQMALIRIVAVLLALMQAVDARFTMNPDGISYLDMSDGVLSGDPRMLINAYWSPVYPLILGLARMLMPGLDDFTAAHVVNVVIFLFFWAGVEFLLRQISRQGGQGLAGRMLIGWFLVWCALTQIGLRHASPDLLLLAISVFSLACARGYIKTRLPRHLYALFLLLGTGFLTKHIFIIPAAVAAAIVAYCGFRKLMTRSHAAVALILLSAVILPWIAALSTASGRLTAGDVSRLAFAWYVNGARTFIHWQGEDPRLGRPLHPTERVLDSPPVYFFDRPFRNATFPPWFDPTYYNEGLVPRLDLIAWTKVALNALSRLIGIVRDGFGYLLFLFVLVTLKLQRKTPVQWPGYLLILPMLIPLAALAVLHIEERLAAPFLSSLMVTLFLIHPPRDSSDELGFYDPTWRPALVAAVLTGGFMVLLLPDYLYSSVISPAESKAMAHLRTARSRGIVDGKKIAVAGSPFDHHWARLAGARIIAHIDMPADQFSNISESKRQEILKMLNSRGCDFLCLLYGADLTIIPVEPASAHQQSGSDPK